MSITSYPRTTAQGTGNGKNLQSGYGIMLFDGATQKYVAATAATFAPIGAGGATAANQTLQIGLETSTRNALTSTAGGNSALIDAGTNVPSLQDNSGISLFRTPTGLSAFKDVSGESNFVDVNKNSVFRSPAGAISYLAPPLIVCYSIVASAGAVIVLPPRCYKIEFFGSTKVNALTTAGPGTAANYFPLGVVELIPQDATIGVAAADGSFATLTPAAGQPVKFKAYCYTI